uniref:Uncharacterized protein n=1 Tax=Ditylenchus dipsaci TaxID=166011 RepID=A0A915CL64_9BILA
MTSKVKKAALKKASLLKTHVGYFNDIFDEFTILKRYKDYKLKKEMSFVEILWKLDEWEMNYLLRTFSQPPNIMTTLCEWMPNMFDNST